MYEKFLFPPELCISFYDIFHAAKTAQNSLVVKMAFFAFLVGYYPTRNAKKASFKN